MLAALRDLHPGVIRFGGIPPWKTRRRGDFEWREAIGDVDHRRPLLRLGRPAARRGRAGGDRPVHAGGRGRAADLRAFRQSHAPGRRRRGGILQRLCGRRPWASSVPPTGTPSRIQIRYWQIGNEQGGPEYEQKLPAFCRAMKRADPRIVLLSSYPSAGVLREAGQYLGYVCPHQYDCSNLSATAEELNRVRAKLRGKARRVGYIRVAVTEWNTTGGDWGTRRAGLWTLENALACARYQNLLHRNCDLVEIACRSNLCNSFCSGIIQTDNHRLLKTPTYYVQQVYATMAGERPLKLRPPFEVDAVPDLSATLSADGKTVTLFAVNPTTRDVERMLDLSAFGSERRELSAWTLADSRGAGEPDVANSFAEPRRCVPTHKSVVATSPRLSYRFPALSLTVLSWPTQ